MRTRALRTLIKISNVGSFVEAADQLGITLSALSMQMKSLEADLGVALFDRKVRPPRLTPLGSLVVEEAIPLLQCEDSLIEICRPRKDLVGRFKLGFVTTAAVRLLPAFLEAARISAPHAKFDIETGFSAALQEKLLTGQIDGAVLTSTDGPQRRLTTRLLRSEPFVFAAHEALLGDGLEGLMTRHIFFHFMPDTGIGKLIAGAMADQSRPADAQTVVLDNLEAIMECVSTGLGFTLLPLPDVDRYLTASVRKLAAPGPAQRNLVLAVLQDGALAKREAMLAALFGAEPSGSRWA